MIERLQELTPVQEERTACHHTLSIKPFNSAHVIHSSYPLQYIHNF